MKVYIVGNDSELASIAKKFNTNIQAVHVPIPDKDSFEENAVIFDFGTLVPQVLYGQISLPHNSTLFFNAPKTTIAELLNKGLPVQSNRLFGFNGLPQLIDASVLEVSVLDEMDTEALSTLMNILGISFECITDTIGMCAPRIISLIINEALFTLQEGTAEKEDIDTAMKLGTNYPNGPFEWLQAIGVGNVYEVLEAVHQYTGEERYRPAALLKKYYLLHSH